jgi:hypothetical protein
MARFAVRYKPARLQPACDAVSEPRSRLRPAVPLRTRACCRSESPASVSIPLIRVAGWLSGTGTAAGRQGVSPNGVEIRRRFSVGALAYRRYSIDYVAAEDEPLWRQTWSSFKTEAQSAILAVIGLFPPADQRPVPAASAPT